MGEVTQPSDVVLVGVGRNMHSISEASFREHARDLPARMGRRRDFMTPHHVAVREYVVRVIGRTGRSVPLGEVAAALSLAESHVGDVLADLERALLFLVRDGGGSVTWAFPITANPTPHRLRYPDRPPIYAA